MASIRRNPLPWTTVYTASTTPKFIPVTGWMPAGQFDKVRATQEIVATQGVNLDITPAFQVGNVENSVTTTGTCGASRTGDGMYYPSGWSEVGTTTDDSQIIRFGWNVALSQAGSLAVATVGGVLEYVVG